MFLTYFLHLNSYLLSFLPNTISRAQLLCFFLLSLLLWNSKHTVSWHRARSWALIACFSCAKTLSFFCERSSSLLFVFRGQGKREWIHWLPHFLLLKARQPLGGFCSNLAHVCSSPEKMFLNMVSWHINQSEKSHDQKHVFERGVPVRMITWKALHLLTWNLASGFVIWMFGNR